MQVQGFRTRVDLPEGWTEVDRSTLPPEIAEIPQVDLFCAGLVGADRYAANLVVMAVELPVGTDIDAWFQDSTSQLVSGIPGIALIDIFNWQSQISAGSDAAGPNSADPELGGLGRTGVYILDDTSLTTTQWSWVESGWGYTATATSATRDFGSVYEAFEQISQTLGTV